MVKKYSAKPKFLPSMIFLLFGLGIIYFGLVFVPTCGIPEESVCDWWDIACNGSKAFSDINSYYAQSFCVMGTWAIRVILALFGGFIGWTSVKGYFR